MDWSQIIAALLGGAFSWFVKSKLNEFRSLREELREKRSGIYADLLEPYIKVFTGSSAEEGLQEIIEQVQSYEYRETHFRLTLLGPDEVVRAYNRFLQYIYSQEDQDEADPVELLEHYGKLLLEIRRSLGNRGTTLTETEMLEGVIKDIEKVQEE